MDKADFKIKFHCKNCGHKISVQDKHTGKRCKCPRCDSVVVVPRKSTIVGFHCESCGQKISVPQVYAGKKCKCPKCKSIVVVPTRPEAPAKSVSTVRFTCSTCNKEIEEPETSRGKLVECPHCGSYVPVPSEKIPAQKAEALVQPGKADDISDERFEELQRGKGKMAEQEPEPVAERRLPWFIDILLYPISASGMVHLAILSFLPRMLLPLGHLNWLHPPIFGLGFLVIFIGYLLYCLSDCIRDSANGGRRAPNIDISPTVLLNIGELISPVLKVFVCIAFCLGPLLAYLIITKRTDIIFWMLVTYGVFFLPMVLLAGVLFDSLRALNPILIIASMFNVFLPYCGLVSLFFVVSGLVAIIITFMPQLPIISYILSAVCIYLTMMMAHLLGRFCYKYREKLNWEV